MVNSHPEAHVVEFVRDRTSDLIEKTVRRISTKAEPHLFGNRHLVSDRTLELDVEAAEGNGFVVEDVARIRQVEGLIRTCTLL